MIMSKPRKAHLASVTQEKYGGELMWIAVDTAGRRFIDPTREGAVAMLELYNNIKEKSHEPR